MDSHGADSCGAWRRWRAPLSLVVFLCSPSSLTASQTRESKCDMCVISGRRPCSRPRTEVRVLRGPFALVRQCKCGVRSKGGHTAAPRSTSASLRMRSCASRSTPLKSAALMPIEPRKPSVCSTNSRLSAPISEKRAKKVSHLGHTPRAIDVSWTWHGRARARAEGSVPPLLHRLERVEEGELAEWIVSAVALAHLDQRRVVAAELLVLRPHHLALKGRLLPAEGRRRHRLRARQLRHHIRLPRRRLLGGRAEVTGGLHTPRCV
mmetsp:Transcript_50342/g.162026  ORF Transcript_50342/g.162026 Transcript_50342/m.162026 type:complete len:264 (+) Transcript_50342:2-793(+)